MIRLVLVLAAVAPYLRTLAFGYVLDDTYAIRGNVSLRGWSSLGQVWLQQFGGDGGPFFGLYRPLTMTIFAIVFNAGARWPLWFHLMALVLHACATLLVWRLLSRALSRWPAFIAALWFAVHPLHVEAVANITNTSEVLVALWATMLALFLLARTQPLVALGWATAAVGGALYLAAMLSKESGAMVAPVAVLLVWGWQRDATIPLVELLRRWWRLVAAFGVAIVAVAIARALVLGGPLTGQPIAALGIADMNAAQRILAMTSLVPRIVELLVWPPGTNPHYGPSTFPDEPAMPAAIGALVLVITIAAGIGLAQRGDRRVLAALAAAALSFLPASNLLVPTGQVLAERTLYLPSIGVAMVLGVLLEYAHDWATSQRFSQRLISVGAGAIGVILLFSAARTFEWTEHWRNHERLFARMMAADPRGYAGYWLAGVEATLQKRPSEGLALFERAYALEHRDRGLVLDLGAALTNHGHFDRAALVYRQALALAPRDSTLNARLRALPVR